MFRNNFWRHFDFWLLGAVIIALIFGVTMIRSAVAGNENLAGLAFQNIARRLMGEKVPFIDFDPQNMFQRLLGRK